MVRLVLTLLVVLLASSARAQSAYVAGTIGADVSRVSHTDSNFYASPDGSETLSGSVRVGTAIGPSWGVELEFVHSGSSHEQVSPSVQPLATTTAIPSAAPIASFTFSSTSANVIPIRFVQSDVRQSHSDLDTLIWVRQGVGGSVDLVYLGGVAFSRQHTEISQNFPTIILGMFAPLPPPNSAFRSTTISYGTHPLAGVEARIGFTSHVRLIPGVRLQGITEGWLLRPYVGLGWFF